MKTLIKQYYKEPQVDSTRIMHTLFEADYKKSPYALYLVPMIAIGGLLLVFFIFLLGLNLSFLSVGLSLYFAIGSSLFLLANVLLGVLVFIGTYHTLLVPLVVLVVAVEMGILFMPKVTSAISTGKQ